MLKENQSCEKINALKELMTQKELDALIIAHDDEYLSYELGDDSKRIEFVSNFSGSAGFICIINTHNEKNIFKEPIKLKGNISQELIIQKDAAIFVDGRYTVQAKEQVDLNLFDIFLINDLSLSDYLKATLSRHTKVGVDSRCIGYSLFSNIKKELLVDNIELLSLDYNLVDLIWEDRPDKIISKLEIYPDEFNGKPALFKRRSLCQQLRDKSLDATIISNPENICWFLNIRGRDRKYVPVINCKVVAYANEALELYIDEGHIDQSQLGKLTEHFGHVDIFAENRFDELLDRLCSSHSSVYIDDQSTNAYIINKLIEGGAKVTFGIGLCKLPQACKNDLEIAGEHKAHLKDGIAMTRFLSWLDEITQLDNLKNQDMQSYINRVNTIDEQVLANKAEAFRKIEGDYLEPSFQTISAIGPNAAMCHYNYTCSDKLRTLGEDPLYLIDSGAQYIEGTTDITRVVVVGPNLSQEMKRMYTLVLKSHIALCTTIFPRGTSGQQLDAIARRVLWDHGFDYAHGTGHGVGHLLSVHEGPQAISTKSSSIPLEEGMVLSIEPGFYKENEFGIRIENLVVVQKCTIAKLEHMLCFEPLTLVPIDTRAIVKEMLSVKEKTWLNNYHQHVLTLLKSAGSTLTDTEIAYLTKACADI